MKIPLDQKDNALSRRPAEPAQEQALKPGRFGAWFANSSCSRCATGIGTPLLLTLLGFSAGSASADEPRKQAEAALKEKPVTDDDRRHWAFCPPVRPSLPEVQEKAWVRNPIDAFILAKLEAQGLVHAPAAERPTLLRRLSFDLTGLPPTPEELDEFETASAPDAFEKVVDRLLESPHYGERCAQHWLDLARYADSDGFEFDQARPDAWRYRDWVVDALNHDLPYDSFVRCQLAGDEIDPDDTASFIATGFNRCYPDMVDLNDQGLRRQNALNDITETTGLVFLGLTIGCARCHDHKFDPIRQSDFYRLQAFFTPARFRDDYPIASAGERSAYEGKRQAWEGEVARLQAAVIALEAPSRAELASGPPPGIDDLSVAAFEKAESSRTAAEIRLVYDALVKDRRVKKADLHRVLGRKAAEVDRLRTQLSRLMNTPPLPLPHARGIDEAGPNAPPTYYLRRGEYTAKGPVVPPAFPAVLDALGSSPTITPLVQSSGRRTALANWLVRPDHPLTARVVVNRLWQHQFGRGIVATASDFGTVGEPPSHRELLDWLAVELVERKWSLKAIHRLIVTSSTYRQSAPPDSRTRGGDPQNLLFGSHKRQRLDGEAIRDALLAAAGQLNRSVGGPPIFPELPSELTKLSSKGAVWPVSPQEADRTRRSLYVFVRRNLRYPFFEAFDRPDTNASCPNRPVTTIAPQALSLLNGKLAQDAAHALAARVANEAGAELPPRICLAYRRALGRNPNPEESRLAREFLERGSEADWDRFCLALLNLNEYIYID
jgi:hypothetical protein